MVRTEDRGCTYAEVEEAEKKIVLLLSQVGLERDAVDLVEIVPKPKEKVKAVRKFDFELDPPVRAGLLYDDAPEKHLIGRYIYLQEDDQQLLDRFCASWLASYEQDKNFFLVLDLETHNLSPRKEDSELLLQCISWDGETGLVFEHQKFDLTLYKQVLNTIPLANHNQVFDFPWMIHHLGVQPILFWDTMVCAQIGWAGAFPDFQGKRYSLDNCVMQLLPPLRMSKTVRKDFYTKRAGTGFSRAQIEYAARDALLTHRLVKPQMIRLANQGLMDLWLEVELPLLRSVIENTVLGIPVNSETATKLLLAKEAEYEERLQELQNLILALPEKQRPKPGPGNFYNPKSAKQLPVILNTVGIKVPNTEAQTLEYALAEHQHPVLEKVMQCRKLTDEIGKFLKKLVSEHIEPSTGCIYPSVSTCGAETGRQAISNPPLHQLQEWARPIIEAEPGCSLIDRDMSQFEFRACAAETGEESLIKLFQDRSLILPDVRGVANQFGWRDVDDFCKKIFSHKAGDVAKTQTVRDQLTEAQFVLLRQFTNLDIHRANASLIFDLPTEEVSGEQRSVAKTLGYAVLYGSGVDTIRASLAKDGFYYSAQECKRFCETFFERLPKVKAFIDTVHKAVKEGGSIGTLLGRKRFFRFPPKYMSRERAKKIADAQRESVNYYFQAANADAIKRSQVLLWQDWKERYPGETRLRTLLSIHDELVVHCPDELVAEVDPQVEAVMVDCGGAAMGYRVPCEVSGSISKTLRKT